MRLFALILMFSFRLSGQEMASFKLNGAWILTAIRMDNTLISSDYPDPGPYRWIYPNRHWLFKDQKICEVDYPCCMAQVSHFAEEKGMLRIKGVNGGGDEVFAITFRNDSLILVNELEYGSSYYLIKDTTLVKELTKFSDGYINPICLHGDWEIPTGEVSVEYDALNVWYPWKMKEQIHVDVNNLHHYWANNRFYLEVDGVKRPFKVAEVSLQTGNMTLLPENWVKDYIKKNKLDTYQVSNVWLRKISR